MIKFYFSKFYKNNGKFAHSLSDVQALVLFEFYKKN